MLRKLSLIAFLIIAIFMAIVLIMPSRLVAEYTIMALVAGLPTLITFLVIYQIYGGNDDPNDPDNFDEDRKFTDDIVDATAMGLIDWDD